MKSIRNTEFFSRMTAAWSALTSRTFVFVSEKRFISHGTAVTCMAYAYSILNDLAKDYPELYIKMEISKDGSDLINEEWNYEGPEVRTPVE